VQHLTWNFKQHSLNEPRNYYAAAPWLSQICVTDGNLISSFIFLSDHERNMSIYSSQHDIRRSIGHITALEITRKRGSLKALIERALEAGTWRKRNKNKPTIYETGLGAICITSFASYIITFPFTSRLPSRTKSQFYSSHCQQFANQDTLPL